MVRPRTNRSDTSSITMAGIKSKWRQERGSMLVAGELLNMIEIIICLLQDLNTYIAGIVRTGQNGKYGLAV